MFDDGVGDGQYAAGGELSGCLGDGMLRQFGDADGLGLQQRYGNVVERHDGHQPGDAEPDADDQLYSDVYDADRFGYHGSGHGDGHATAGAEPASQFNECDGRNTGKHLGHRLCGHIDVVNGSERSQHQRDANG